MSGQPERCYAVEELKSLQSSIADLTQSMVIQRARVEKYKDTDLAAARDNFSLLQAVRRKLAEAIGKARLFLMEAEEYQNAKTAAMLQAGLLRFDLMSNVYRPVYDAIQDFIKKFPVDGTANAAVIGRLMNNVRLGYYPTDPDNISLILRGIQFPEEVTTNLFDPCCGCGKALRQLAQGNHCYAYGVELDESRAEEAQTRLHRVGFGSFFFSQISHEAFHLLFLNPPYLSVLNEFGGRTRHEKRFLIESLPHLMYGGLLVYVIPYYRLTPDICRVLVDNFEGLTVWRFTDGEFKKFKQIAVMGLRKRRSDVLEDALWLEKYTVDPAKIPSLTEIPEGQYPLPAQPLEVKTFKGEKFNEKELERQLRHYDSFAQLMFGERDVFLSIFNPLYFIEELGDEGKNLLEMYLPMIPHETVMGRLSDGIQAALEGVEIPSPDAVLKNRREEIRKLEEHMIYLQGQKDQAVTQAEAQRQSAAALTERYSQLDSELKALEGKRFAGLDRARMESDLVALSARYNEAAQGSSTAQIDADILALSQKQAQRRAQQYQPKFTQEIAQANARVQELGKQYQRENQILKAFVPGISCPTCRRPVTEENLPEVQVAIQTAINHIVANGRSQRIQVAQLQEQESKDQAVFDQFQAEDIIKMQDEIDALTKRRDKLTADGQTDNLREQIQRLSAGLEYGNLSQQEYDRLLACKDELQRCAAELAAARKAVEREQPDFDSQITQAQQKVKALKVLISNVVIYARKRAELTFEALKMNRVAISLYDVMKTSGEQKAAFKFTYNGRRYDRLSLSEKIRAGMEVSELVKRLTGRNYPVFVDNMESVDDLANVRPTGQVIMAKCVHGAPLEVRPLRPIPTATEQRAA